MFDSAGLAAYASGSPGQVLGWLPSGALGALWVALACIVLPPTWGLPLAPLVEYPGPTTWPDGLTWS